MTKIISLVHKPEAACMPYLFFIFEKIEIQVWHT